MSNQGTDNTLYLLDVSSFIFRAYYSVGHLSKRDGTPTGAVFGVANMIVSLVSEHRPSHIAAAMDSRTPTFRKELYPAYKANRPPPPDDLRVQFPLVAELLAGFALPVIQLDGFEADDLIATATRRARAAGLDVVIVSGDKDLMQLVGQGVVVLDTMKNKVWDEGAVQEKWGVPPQLLGDLLALAGDSSDNIPGVPRVGPKTAAPLLVEYGGLDSLLASCDGLKSKALAKRLREHEADARLSRRLVALREDVPIDGDMASFAYRQPDEGRLAEVLDSFEFVQLKARLGVETPPNAANVAAAQVFVDYRTVSSLEALREIVAEIRRTRLFAVDLETTSTDATRAEIVGVALSYKEGVGFYVPTGHRKGGNLLLDDVLTEIKPLLEDPDIGVVAQNVKYEDTLFRRHGIYIRNVAFDPMLASYLVRLDSRRHNLDTICLDVLNRKMMSYDEVTEKSRTGQLTFNAVTVERATEYAGEDAEVAFALAAKMTPMVKEHGAEDLLYRIEIPLARVLSGIELAGVAVDTGLLSSMSVSFGERLMTLEGKAYELAGHELNLASPKQLQTVLFEELGLPTQTKTKTGYSTNSEVLEILAPMHPFPRLLLEHRMLSKLKNTYLDTLPKLVNPATGRIHTSFNQAVAATGRLSSSNPNLQNIPIRSDLGREIRRAFVSAPGHQLVSCDYSQVELRVLAHLSGDPELMDAFEKGDDIHARTARAIFGFAPGDEVQKEDRAKAKAVNFGVIYGKTPFSLARELEIPRAEASRFIDEYFRLYAGVKTFMEKVIEDARRDRYVTTLLGRKRELRDIESRNHTVRGQAERMARNTPIQGTAADLLKLAMIRTDERLREMKSAARMILTVHDELVFEMPKEELETTVPELVRAMESARTLDVPLVVDVGMGDNWAEAH